MTIPEIQALILTTLDDHKALDIRALDVTSLTDITDAMIICTATSNRHAMALSDHVQRALRDTANLRPLGTEGEDTAEWILLDYADIIVHIMLKETREFYSLEKLWTAAEQQRQSSP